MNKSEVVSLVAERTKMSKVATANVLDVLLDVVTEQLAAGNDVSLTGYLILKVADKAPTKGRNPKDGSVINIPAKRKVSAKIGKTMKEQVNAAFLKGKK